MRQFILSICTLLFFSLVTKSQSTCDVFTEDEIYIFSDDYNCINMDTFICWAYPSSTWPVPNPEGYIITKRNFLPFYHSYNSFSQYENYLYNYQDTINASYTLNSCELEYGIPWSLPIELGINFFTFTDILTNCSDSLVVYYTTNESYCQSHQISYEINDNGLLSATVGKDDNFTYTFDSIRWSIDSENYSNTLYNIEEFTPFEYNFTTDGRYSICAEFYISELDCYDQDCITIEVGPPCGSLPFTDTLHLTCSDTIFFYWMGSSFL